MYVKLSNAEFGRNKKVSDNLIVNLDKNGCLMGVEILFLSDIVPNAELEKLQSRAVL